MTGKQTTNAEIEANDTDYGTDPETELDIGWLADTIAYRLRMAQEAAFHRYRVNLSEFSSLHPGHFTALSVIAANPGCNQTQLGAVMGRDKSTLTVLLNALDRQKLILRERRADNQRTYALNLTDQGHAVLKALRVVGEEHEQAISDCFTVEEKTALMGYLQRIIDHRYEDLTVGHPALHHSSI